jgi:calcineurin-like phosphoesterase family protein
MPNKVYFMSDPQFSHNNILKYCKRPFLSTEEQDFLDQEIDFKVSDESTHKMGITIINNINAVVEPNDSLWILGDFTLKGYDTAKYWRDMIACKNINLVWGNHDRREIAPLFNETWDQVAINVKGQRLFLNHYPMRSWFKSHRSSWNLYGHVHGNLPDARYLPEDQMLLCLDVGVDPPVCNPNYEHQFRPWSFEEIAEILGPKAELGIKTQKKRQ